MNIKGILDDEQWKNEENIWYLVCKKKGRVPINSLKFTFDINKN